MKNYYFYSMVVLFSILFSLNKNVHSISYNDPEAQACLDQLNQDTEAFIKEMITTGACSAELTARENTLLDTEYVGKGLGKRKYNASVLRVPNEGLLKKVGIGTRLNSDIKRGIKLFKKVLVPVMKSTMPELFNKKNEMFMAKILRETLRNFVFVELTADMHGDKAPDMANLWFSLSHPIYDAIFDCEFEDTGMTIEKRLARVTRIIMRDYNIENANKSEKLLIEIVKGLDSSVPEQNVELFFDELFKLNIAQIESERQKNKESITNEELRYITFNKGGLSMELYALLADHDFTSAELDTYFLEGAMLQNLDDMSDFPEDAKEGNVTLIGRGLITPEEIYEMRDIWIQRFVKEERYNANEVLVYQAAIDLFIENAREKYHLALNPPKEKNWLCASTITVTKGILGGVMYPFKLIYNFVFPGMKYLK